jgi:hypothetical protein
MRRRISPVPAASWKLRRSEPSAGKRGPRPAADQDDYKRATFIVKKDLLEKLKYKAYEERKDIKQIINEILEEALKETR